MGGDAPLAASDEVAKASSGDFSGEPSLNGIIRGADPQPWHRENRVVEAALPSARAPRLGAERFAGVFTPGTHDKISYGDLVIVVESHTSQRGVYVEVGGELHLRFGTFLHDSWVGLPYGSTVTARPRKNAPQAKLGYIYLLAPNPTLWTATLRHRTQINFSHDIASVLLMLDVQPGKVVAECGTGSGSLSTHLCCAVAPGGFLHTYEYHAERARAARMEFERNGIDHLVNVEERDIMGNGFPDELEGRVDAVFLDVPGPHQCVRSARKILRPYGRICSFSPCIEQVAKACEALGKNGFTEISTVQLQLREFETRTEVEQPTIGKWLSELVSESPAVRKRAVHEALMAKHAKKRREQAGPGQGGGQDVAMEDEVAANGGESVREGFENEVERDALDDDKSETNAENFEREAEGQLAGSLLRGGRRVTFHKPITPDMKTHTGFLTFATAPIRRPWGAGNGGDCCNVCGGTLEGHGRATEALPNAQEKIIQEVLDSHDKATLVFVE